MAFLRNIYSRKTVSNIYQKGTHAYLFSTHVARMALTCSLLYSGVPYAISYAQALIAPPVQDLSTTANQTHNPQNQSAHMRGLGDHPTQLSQEPKDNLKKTSEDDKGCISTPRRS